MENKIDCHEINQFCIAEIQKLMQINYANLPIEEKLDNAALSPMFSFWREIQSLMNQSSEEIKALRAELKKIRNPHD